MARPDFAFALASCQYPPGLLDGHIARRALDQIGPLKKMLGVDRLVVPGDQIYVDATAGLFDPSAVGDARSAAYETMRMQRSALRGIGLAVHTMLDDHEIGDNWEPISDPDEPGNQRLMIDGCSAYAKACRANGYGALPDYRPGDRIWYHFAPTAALRFFMADTRTERTLRRTGALASARLMSTCQAEALYAWIAEVPEGAVGFVTCPAIVLPRRLATAGRTSAAIHSDAWDGYPASLHHLLAVLCDAAHGRVVLLSGDEHFPCLARVELCRDTPGSRVRTLHSIHAPALYAPYPFANDTAANLALEDDFAFEHDGVRYRCRVSTDCPAPDNGFAVISGRARETDTELEVGFHSTDSGGIRTIRFAVER